MKEPRNILQWEKLSDNQKKRALKEFPGLENRVRTTYKWIGKMLEFEQEIIELLGR